MANANITSDLSVLTTIPENTLNRLNDLTMKCIAHAVFESSLNRENTCIVDIGIGKLIIAPSEEDVNIRFEPSQKMESMLVDAINKKEDPLTLEVEKVLSEKIMRTYKDLL